MLEGETEGLLAIKAAWPSTIREVWGDYEPDTDPNSNLYCANLASA